ncbi:MAG: hypothetical protein KF862_03700 [Chitinophagaceae bacterium]|nr:hypothetical protein [Chitinophagaceae bacterium]
MKTVIITLAACLFVLSSYAQQPVEWSFYAKKISGNTYEIHLTANIDKGWYICSQFSGKKGPSPTEIKITPVKGLSLAEKFEERGTLQKGKNAVQNYQFQYFENQVDFVQVVTLRKNENEKINAEGAVSFAASNGSQTLPTFTVNFSMPLD